MSYNTGTLSAGANPAKELMDTLQPIIDGHAGWQFIEQVPGTVTTTKRVDVYKCLGTVNSIGQDFYMGIMRSADNGNFGISIAEQYDGTGKRFTNAGVYQTGSVAVNADGTHANSTAKHVANESCVPVNTMGFIYGASTPTAGTPTPSGTPATSSTPWFLSVTKDCITLSCGAIQTYTGLFDPAYTPAIDPFPLVTTQLHPVVPFSGSFTSFGTAMGGGVSTRDVGGATSLANPGALPIDGGLIRYIGTSQSTASKDPISGLWNAQRVALMSNTRRNARRGLLKNHVVAISMGEVSEGVGDTITIDGVTYTCFLTPNLSASFIEGIWVSQAA